MEGRSTTRGYFNRHYHQQEQHQHQQQRQQQQREEDHQSLTQQQTPQQPQLDSGAVENPLIASSQLSQSSLTTRPQATSLSNSIDRFINSLNNMHLTIPSFNDSPSTTAVEPIKRPFRRHRNHSNLNTGAGGGGNDMANLFAQQVSLLEQQYPPSTKLNQLSTQERTLALEDLHGVTAIDDEEPERIANLINEMDICLEDSLLSNGKDPKMSGIQHALAVAAAASSSSDGRSGPSMSPAEEYIQKTKLLCLRAEYYDPAKGAARMIRFFQLKYTLFRKELLTKDIHYQDLEPEDQKYVNSGMIQALAERDRAGRAMLLLIGSLLKKDVPTPCLIRVLTYISLLSLEDVEVSKKGIVLLYYAVGKTEFVKDRPYHLSMSWSSLPMKIVAIHGCYDNPLLQPLMSLVSFCMEHRTLCRFRAHKGTHVECVYNLMTFGIPKHCFPIDVTGFIDMNFHQHWLECAKNRGLVAKEIEQQRQVQQQQLHQLKREQQQQLLLQQQQMQQQQQSLFQEPIPSSTQAMDSFESNSPTPSTTTTTAAPARPVLIPGPMDVIMGRGRHGRNTPGNIRFRQLLVEYSSQYDAASKFEKTVLAETILKILRDGGSRFLKSTKDGWIEVESDITREKVSHAFRNLRPTTSNNRNRNSNNSTSSRNNQAGEKRLRD